MTLLSVPLLHLEPLQQHECVFIQTIIAIHAKCCWAHMEMKCFQLLKCDPFKILAPLALEHVGYRYQAGLLYLNKIDIIC